GMVDALAELEMPLLRYLGGAGGGLFSGFGKQKTALERITGHPDYIALNLLALAKLARGQHDEAWQTLEIAQASRIAADQASYSSIDLSLEQFTASHCLHTSGDVPGALAAARQARELAPDIEEVERWLAHIEDREPEFPDPDWIGKPFPVAYELEASDPINEVVTPIDRVGFREIVDTLRPGEFLLVMALGTYRSNYYYNLDMERVAELKRAFPDRLREVHVITHGTYALDADHRRRAEGLCRELNLPFVILWDEGAEVANAAEADGWPARFMVDHTGTIRSTERLMEEEGFWAALARASSPGASASEPPQDV
ncbi:MAG: hypothetical protein AAGJ70_07680, partial [Pseudomonadota bacterium]